VDAVRAVANFNPKIRALAVLWNSCQASPHAGFVHVSGPSNAMNDTGPSIRLQHRGNYTEVLIGSGKLAEWAYTDLVAQIRATPVKPLILVWEASREDLDFLQAFNMGMALAGLTAHIAIVFSGDDINEAGRFTELVARNRGAQVRICEDVTSAKAWLGVY
jgi:hypothetical protein